MPDLDNLSVRIHESFDQRSKVRDEILAQARKLTRYCAHAIRAVHREEWDQANEQLNQARSIVLAFKSIKETYPDLYYAGYTQDALKEFAEANLVNALINHHPLPDPEDLLIEFSTYLQGLAEAVGELRRRCLDLLLHQRILTLYY